MIFFKNKFLSLAVSILLVNTATLSAVEYSKKGTVEISGQASMEYNNTPDSRRGTTYYWLSLQPIASYFPWDNWYLGAGVQGNLTYVTGPFGGWGYFGDVSVLGGRTVHLRENIFGYGQLEAGISLPQGESAGTLTSNYYFFRPAMGIKYLVSNVVLNLSLQYNYTRIRYSFDTDYYSVHNLRIAMGIGFYF